MAPHPPARNALTAKLKWTLLLTALYAVLAALGDYLINGVLLGQPEVLTPAADVALALLIGAPSNFYFLSQRFDLRQAIAERAVLEGDLKQALVEAQAAGQAKADFLANMTHELRTPLNAIVGFTALLRSSRTLAASDARQVELVYEAGLTLLGVVNDVLDFSKLASGPVHLEQQAFDPTALAESCGRVLAGQAEAKGLTIAVSGPEPSLMLNGDPLRLRQVLLNFMSNAIKFTERGGVQVRVRLAAEDRLRVEVEDTGIGVPADRVQAIFERFIQADAAVARRYGGTGLGLAISKKLIQAMGGQVGVHSIPGQGSTFWFDIPAVPAEVEAPPPGVDAGPSAQKSGARVLVADDNAVNRELIAAIMRPSGFEIEFAANGAQAIDAAARSPFDLILMDVQMPVIDGLTATRRIRAAQGGDGVRVPIVAMTANVLAEQVQACLAAGMDDHLGKPIQPRALLDTVARWMAAGPAGADEDRRRA